MMNLLISLMGMYFFLITSLVNIKNKELVAKSDALSKYVYGKYGFYLTIGFLVIGLNQIILGYMIGSFAGLGLYLSGIGVIIVGLFKLREHKKIHNIGAAMQFLFFPVALLLKFISQKIYFDLAFGVITLSLAGVLALFYYKNSRYKTKHFGLVQKADIYTINIWLIITPMLL